MALFKYLLIFGLVIYVIYKIASFFFRMGAAARQMQDQHRNRDTRGPAGRRKQGTGYKGGEYIDYEEVK